MTRRTASRRAILQGAAAAALAAPWVTNVTRAQGKTLYINSYGGVLDTSWAKAFFVPFTAKTGVAVKTVPPVSFAKLKAQVQTRNFEWDMTGIGASEFAQAINEGLLEKTDRSILNREQVPAGMVGDYGVSSYTLGTNIVYRKDKFPTGGPQTWADFWNVKKFPGNRCLFDRSFTCLAFALIADGVPVDQIYPMDIDRAFKKMSEIKPHIKVWWTQGTQSQQLIRDGEVDMIGMWSARATDLMDAGTPLELVWNGCENYTSSWCVPKGSPNAKLAWEFIAVASQAQPQADLTKLMPYGPTNLAALPLVPEARLKETPSWPANAKVSFQHDSAWLAPRLPQIRERWSQWMTG